MVYENTGQLLSNGLGKHNSRNRGINAAGKSAEYLTGTDFFPKSLDCRIYEGIHFPVAGAAADIIYKVGKHLCAFFRVNDLRMELNCIEILLGTLHTCYRTGLCMSSDAETGRNLSNIYAVAHPADGFGRYTVKKLRGCIHVYFCMSIFAYNGFFNNAVQQVAHQLSAIADSQNRNTQFKNLLRAAGCSILKYHIGTAGKNDSLGIHLPNLIQTHVIGMYLAVNITFTDTAGNQLVILAAKV